MSEDLNHSTINLLISGFLEKNAQEIPDLPAIICDRDIVSHSALHHLVLGTTTVLKNLNISPGVNVALRFNDPIKHLVFYFSLLKIGITQISINPKDSLKSQNKIISQAHIELVIQDISLNDKLLENSLHMSKEWKFSSQQRIFTYKKPSDTYHNPATITIGSGTTGEPKIFSMPFSTLAYQLKHELIPDYEVKGERYYCVTELYYTFPKQQAIRALLKNMTILLPTIKPRCIASFCIEQQIHHLELTGSQVLRLLEEEKKLEKISFPRLPKLKSLVLGSSLVTDPIRKKIRSKITNNLFIHYGTNEFGSISMANAEDIIQYPGTVGKNFPGIALSIRDNNGNPCPRGEIGNILVKSDEMITSYLNNPEETKKVFSSRGYYPGDMGRLTEDGNLIFEGRNDDMMIYSGVNIYPRELESVLESHPKVIESAVFPLYTKSYEGIPFAVVSVSSPVNESELARWCASELEWRKPHRIFFIKKLPRNKAGKVLKRVLSKKVAKILSELANSKNNSIDN